MTRFIALVIAAVQILLAIRFLNRVRSTTGGMRIGPAKAAVPDGSITVLVPVFNEIDRLGYCMDSLVRSGNQVREILVVDGGSRDGTPLLVDRFSEIDARVRLISGGTPPEGWNGKAWNLQSGLQHASSSTDWLVTIDADVTVDPGGVVDAVAFAISCNIPFLSVATRQRASTPGLSIVHPSLLSTLVYRFGIPGHVARTLDEVQSNGQFGVFRSAILMRTGGFSVARDSICEDVTIARHLFLIGYEVGFFEGDHIAETSMYSSGIECLQNWPRSLSLRDQFVPNAGITGLVASFFLQVVPIVSLFWLPSTVRNLSWFVALNRSLVAARFGVAVGTYRAYSRTHFLYWLSPLFDPIAWLAYVVNLASRRHTWRGRQLVSQEA